MYEYVFFFGLDTTLKICKDYPRMETDYSNHDHHLVCVSSEELGELWKTGHCHNPKTGLYSTTGGLSVVIVIETLNVRTLV